MNKVLLTDVSDGIRFAKKQRLKFDLIICDPPYNVGKNFGKHKKAMSLESYLEWTQSWLNGLFKLLKPNGLIYIYGFAEILAHISVRFSFKSQRWLVWHYTNKTVPGSSFWQRSHESILCLWTQKKFPKLQIDQIREPYTENYLKCAGKTRKDVKSRFGNRFTKYQAHQNGALPRDVIKIPALAGGAGFKERWFKCEDCDEIYPPGQLKNHLDHSTWKHPTQKPQELTKRLIGSVVKYGKDASVLIPFAGSGSECVVSRRLGLDFLGFEICADYVDFANRWLELEASGANTKPHVKPYKKPLSGDVISIRR